jgi:hypothetical protein
MAYKDKRGILNNTTGQGALLAEHKGHVTEVRWTTGDLERLSGTVACTFLFQLKLLTLMAVLHELIVD